MTREIRTLEQAKQVIEPIKTELIKCIENGFLGFLKHKDLKDKNLIPIEFEERTKANITHDYIKANVKNCFSQNKKLKIGDFNNVFGINIENKIFIRFKKMNEDLHVSSYKTTQHQKYMGQQQINGFPEKPTFVFAGYIPNKTWTGLKGIYIACWNNDVLEWYDQTGKYWSEQKSINFDIPTEDFYKVVERRVKAKQKKQLQKINNL